MNPKIETINRKNDLIKQGWNFVTLETYKEILSTFGLKLDNNSKHLYYNNLNRKLGNWLECSIDAIDETNKGFANIYGTFYNNHAMKRTDIYIEFKKFRNTYFTELKTGHLICI
jgi:hypothetical protein